MASTLFRLAIELLGKESGEEEMSEDGSHQWDYECEGRLCPAGGATEQRSIQGVDGDGGPHAAMQGVLLARSAHHLLVGAINYPKFAIR